MINNIHNNVIEYEGTSNRLFLAPISIAHLVQI